MSNMAQIVSSRPLRTALAKYTNLYLPLSEAVEDGDSTVYGARSTVLDVVNNYNWKVATPGAGQWEDGGTPAKTTGYWTGLTGNTTDFIDFKRSDNQALFDSLFSLGNGVGLLLVEVERLADPAAACRLFTVASETGALFLPEIKYLTDGSIQPFWSSAGAAQIKIGTHTTNNTVTLAIIYDFVNSTLTFHVFERPNGSGSAEIAKSTSASLDTVSGYIDTSREWHASIGASFKSGFGTFYRYLTDMRVRRFRWVNFGVNPPADINEFIEELAVNNLIGTRRDY